MKRRSFLSSIAAFAAGVGIGKATIETVNKVDELAQPKTEGSDNLSQIRPAHKITDIIDGPPKAGMLIVFYNSGHISKPYLVTNVCFSTVTARHVKSGETLQFDYKKDTHLKYHVITNAFSESKYNERI